MNNAYNAAHSKQTINNATPQNNNNNSNIHDIINIFTPNINYFNIDANKTIIHRCFSLLRMAIDNFHGAAQGTIININLTLLCTSHPNDKKLPYNTTTKQLVIQMGELQTNKHLKETIIREIQKLHNTNSYNIKGIINSGKQIGDDNTALCDEFWNFKQNKITCVYKIEPSIDNTMDVDNDNQPSNVIPSYEFECAICSTSFSQKKDLITHYKESHTPY